ncbi:hypothetical protein Tco_0297555, partial [Tanacetum coccineum]
YSTGVLFACGSASLVPQLRAVGLTKGHNPPNEISLQVGGTGCSLKYKKNEGKPDKTESGVEKSAKKTEAKGAKGLKTKLKRTFPDRLDNVCAFNEVKTKSKSTPGYGVGKGIENQT